MFLNKGCKKCYCWLTMQWVAGTAVPRKGRDVEEETKYIRPGFAWLLRDLFMPWCLTLFCQVSSSSRKLEPLPLHLLSTLYFPWSHLPVCLLFRFHALWPFLPIVPEQRLYQDSNGREILFVCCCHRNATLVVRLAMKYIEVGWYLIANIVFLLPVKKESSDRQM